MCVRASRKVRTRTTQNWSHKCVHVCGSWFFVPNFLGILLLLLISRLYHRVRVCMLRAVFGFFFRLISSRCIYFSFYLLLYGYFVTLWLVFVHFTEQDENLWIVGSTDFAFGECSQLCNLCFYRTNLQRRLNICMLFVEWTAAIFKTKCNAIDTRWFACLHFGRSLLCMVVVVAIFGIPLHYNHTQASTHSVIYSAHRSLLSIKSVKIDTQKIQGKTNDTLCSISIYLFIMGFYFRYLYTHFVLLSWIFYVFFAWKQKKSRLWEKWDINWWKNVQIQHSTAQHSVKPKRKHQTQ